MIRFSCHHCNVAVNAPPKAAGKKARCPKCGATLTVPSQISASAAVTKEEPLDELEEVSVEEKVFCPTKDSNSQVDHWGDVLTAMGGGTIFLGFLTVFFFWLIIGIDVSDYPKIVELRLRYYLLSGGPWLGRVFGAGLGFAFMLIGTGFVIAGKRRG